MKMLRTAEDVTPEILAAAEEVESGWFGDRPIDWDDFIDRLCAEYGGDDSFDIDQYDNPAIRKIQRHIRQMRRMG